MTTAKLEGLPIIDGKKALTLNITKQDIVPAGRRKPDKCAAAMAVERELHTEARIHLSRIYIKTKKNWIRYEMPTALRTEVVSFDRGGSFEEGEFFLRPIRPSHVANGTTQGGNNKESTGTGKPRAPAKYTSNVRIRAPISLKGKRK